MTPDSVWPPFPALRDAPDTPLTLADALAQWANDTLANQATWLAQPGGDGRPRTSLLACHAWVEGMCKALLSRALEAPPVAGRPVLLLAERFVVECPADLLPSLGRLQELGALGHLGGYQLVLPGILATSLAQCRGLDTRVRQERPEPAANGVVGEDTPLLPVARGGKSTDHCVVS